MHDEWHGEIAEQNPALYQLIDTAGTAHSVGMRAYLTFMGVRLLELHRVLKSTGSLYLHCDDTAAHYLKGVLDCVFGSGNFRNEIVWCYSNSGRAKKFFAKKSDTLLLYTKSKYGFWGDYRIPVSQKYLDSHYRQTDDQGRRCRIRVDAGKRRVYYPDEGMICNNWWSDIPQSQLTGQGADGLANTEASGPTESHHRGQLQAWVHRAGPLLWLRYCLRGQRKLGPPMGRD